MEQRPHEPRDEPLMRAFALLRTAAYVLRDLDFETLDELDQDAMLDWDASLRESADTLVRTLGQRNCAELEAPPRGQLDRYDEARVKHHVQGISKAILSEFERIDATPGNLSQISTSVLLGLLYSQRSIEQFIRWLDPVNGARARAREVAREAAREVVRQAAREAARLAVPPAPPVLAPVPVASPAPVASPPAAPDLGLPIPAAPPVLPPAPPPSSKPRRRREPDPEPEPLRPKRRDVDLGGFLERPDEYGGALRRPPLSVFHGCARGPELAKVERCLDATCVAEYAGGVVFALADGPDTSIGSRLAAGVATAAFCQHLAEVDEEPPDVRAALLAAAEAARRHLDTLLDALIDSADESEAISLLRGAHPANTVRRILEHTRSPDAKLRNVVPALAVSLTAGVLRWTPDAYELSFLSIGGAVVERKRRGQSPETLLPEEPSAARFGPGGASPWQPDSVQTRGPVELRPGDLVIVGSTNLLRSYEASAFDKLEVLAPDVLSLTSSYDAHALHVLRRAGAAADRYDALDEKRMRAMAESGRTPPMMSGGARRQPLFAGDLSMILLTVASRVRRQSIAQANPEDVVDEPISRAARDSLANLVRVIKRPPPVY